MASDSTVPSCKISFLAAHRVPLKLSSASAADNAAIQRWQLDADTSQKSAVAKSTHAKHASGWRRWLNFLTTVGHNDDPFLQQLPPNQHHRLFCLFAAAVRENGPSINGQPVSSKTRPTVQEGSVRAALDAVAQTFRTNQLSSPIHDASGRLNFVLGRQLKGYTNADPSTKPQKALPPSVLRQIASSTPTPLDEAVAQLTVGAFFFAMRSCEYSKVPGLRRTKLIAIGNVRFYSDKQLTPHTSKQLHLADCVTITFVFQKNDTRDESITMHRTLDPTLCPVRAWAAITTRIRGYPDVTDETPVNTFRFHDRNLQVKATQILSAIRAAVKIIGPTQLGFTADEVGTHSIRSSAAMAMYLAGVPVYTIMLIGRWSSDAFLRYIRRQVQEFSSGVSGRMLLTTDYFTIPEHASIEDPRAPGNTLNFAPRNQNGRGVQTSVPTAMALWI